MNKLPTSQETHGSFVVKKATLVFIPTEGKPVDIATYSAQEEAIRVCQHHNNYLVGVGCGATVVE